MIIKWVKIWGKFIDLTGKRFGKLVVKKRGEDLVTTRHYTRWYCDCGENDILVTSRNLISGKTTSCGCYKLEKLVERNKKSKQYNKYDLSGEYGIGE